MKDFTPYIPVNIDWDTILDATECYFIEVEPRRLTRTPFLRIAAKPTKNLGFIDSFIQDNSKVIIAPYNSKLNGSRQLDFTSMTMIKQPEYDRSDKDYYWVMVDTSEGEEIKVPMDSIRIAFTSRYSAAFMRGCHSFKGFEVSHYFEVIDGVIKPAAGANIESRYINGFEVAIISDLGIYVNITKCYEELIKHTGTEFINASVNTLQALKERDEPIIERQRAQVEEYKKMLKEEADTAAIAARLAKEVANQQRIEREKQEEITKRELALEQQGKKEQQKVDTLAARVAERESILAAIQVEEDLSPFELPVYEPLVAHVKNLYHLVDGIAVQKLFDEPIPKGKVTFEGNNYPELYVRQVLEGKSIINLENMFDNREGVWCRNNDIFWQANLRVTPVSDKGTKIANGTIYPNSIKKKKKDYTKIQYDYYDNIKLPRYVIQLIRKDYYLKGDNVYYTKNNLPFSYANRHTFHTLHIPRGVIRQVLQGNETVSLHFLFDKDGNDRVKSKEVGYWGSFTGKGGTNAHAPFNVMGIKVPDTFTKPPILRELPAPSEERAIQVDGLIYTKEYLEGNPNPDISFLFRSINDTDYNTGEYYIVYFGKDKYLEIRDDVVYFNKVRGHIVVNDSIYDLGDIRRMNVTRIDELEIINYIEECDNTSATQFNTRDFPRVFTPGYRRDSQDY